jgi:nucleoside-diphosphate-sugar epimerase
MKILVLGSAGQIGKSTVDFLKQKNHDVIEWDIVTDESHDLRKYNEKLKEEIINSDFIYYFASDVGGAKYLENKQNSFDFIYNNMMIMCNTFTLLSECKKPFIFTSSQMAELYHSTYGLLKLLGEKMTNDIGGLVVRLWNVYGIENDEEKSHVITDFVKMAKNNGIITMRTDGEESRQLLYAEDCAECMLNLTERYDILDKSKNYHITSFEWIKIKEVADIISELTGCSVEIGKNKDKTQMNAMNPPDTYILNFWQPKTKLKDGIKSIIDNIK